MILAIKTDQPEAELHLYDASTETVSYVWLADRQLARDLLRKCDEFLLQNDKSWSDLSGLIVFRGPGSFTGLRIGITTIISAAYALGIPAVGESGSDWLANGVDRLTRGESDELIEPEYGAGPRISQPRK